MGYTVVLAYSGGLDTSIILPWLKERYAAEVVCVAADVGQAEELEGLEAKARRQGAAACHILDLRESFVTEAIWPTLRAGAVYSRTYLLGTAMARPIVARAQARLALELGAQALAHGCTGKGNDQVRFELTYAAYAPELAVIAPWREWDIRSREEAIDYARARGIEVTATREKIFSRDRNLWHISHEGGPLEDPAYEPPADLFMLTRAPEEAPNQAEYVEIGFESGYPVAIDGVYLSPVALLETLNAVAGEHGIGRADVVEDRLVGMKSRGVYETPGGTLLRQAHRELEMLVLDRRTLALKDELAARYADLVYEGRWWSLEREALDALVDRTQEPVTGTVRLKLYKGNATVAARTSPRSLYDQALASFDDAAAYDHADAAGFIRLFSLPARLQSRQHPAESASVRAAGVRLAAPGPATNGTRPTRRAPELEVPA
ncbi:MAG: argininosuccinate synthase [Longimicrobiales bacterium]